MCPEQTFDKRYTRLVELDALRGLVMVLMVLDHARDFFGDHGVDALNLAQTHPALFLSRWVTHLCAPTFVFLAGMSAFLALGRSLSARNLGRHLLIRGLFLVVLEQTLLRCFGWYFNLDYRYMNAGILWGTGWSMALLGVMLRGSAPTLVIGCLGAGFAAGHGGLSRFLGNAWWWTPLLRSDDLTPRTGWHFYTSYPVLPWFGVMALGYTAAALLKPGTDGWHGRSLRAGLASLFFFGAARAAGWPIDPQPWTPQRNILFTVFALVNFEKYPPSPAFLTFTLGAALILLAVMLRLPVLPQQWLVSLGRVPLFFYVVHIFTLHALALTIAWCRYGRVEWLHEGPGIFWSETLPGHPAGYGLGLGWVALIWASTLAALTPASRAYGRFKRLHPAGWLAFL
ncbi:MAG TPA: heparan-alpha-glucosaminide N-acetyltransferase domain-containing protein [Chthoniobacterales bacterium]